MKLVLKQRLFSWFDSYDVCDEYGNAVFSVKGRLAWGHLLEIYDNMGNKVGVLKEKVLKLFPTFEIYIGGEYMGCIKPAVTAQSAIGSTSEAIPVAWLGSTVIGRCVFC